MAARRRNANTRSQSRSGKRVRSRTVRTGDRAFKRAGGIVKKAARETERQQKQMAAAATRTLDKAKKKWSSAERNVRGYIKKNPKKAAAIATGAAVALGAAVAAAMKNRRK